MEVKEARGIKRGIPRTELQDSPSNQKIKNIKRNYQGPNPGLNRRPLTPKARILPLNYQAYLMEGRALFQIIKAYHNKGRSEGH